VLKFDADRHFEFPHRERGLIPDAFDKPF